jgi:putative FmdB family regulatory protein
MPIYAYRCESCGHAKDAIQKFSDAPLTICPSCGADAFRKQLSAPSFQLKGSGWYVTDFRDNGKSAAKPDAAKADGAPAQEGAAKEGAAKDGAAKEGAPAAAPAAGGSEPAKPASGAAAPAAATPSKPAPTT